MNIRYLSNDRETNTSKYWSKQLKSRYLNTSVLKVPRYLNLVGISPSGAFTFVSKLWSGGISDRNITQKSGLIDKLEPLDDVMADRGFNIRDMVTKKKASLNIPPLQRGSPFQQRHVQKPGE